MSIGAVFDDDKERETIEFAQASTDQGLPVIGWSLFRPEFGLNDGYDDEKQELYCRDPQQDGALPYTKRNELPMKFVCMLRVTDSDDADRLEARTKGLQPIHRGGGALRGLQRLFPFPHGGEPNEPAIASEAEALLMAAKWAEEQGAAALERMYEALTGECVS
ncbi:MAG: hypothetical protein E6230_07065 [Paenibacillus dendritiformis]|uniref:hypothetical protein n=1 Tax=Paenibacillus dendritiformis TaxID=130049 RepID=UPI00143DE4AA|nr:hypothetical protein [Paenibacillus dendritiformis]MDU5141924.1 hypothetical protein [Paenibacillus dendritiformis]NKI20819.1 hypothetical protein [Paenibacillus dendritiformis]NRG00301.1 hypothetical protein [Paenibacillus dendritiformis]